VAHVLAAPPPPDPLTGFAIGLALLLLLALFARGTARRVWHAKPVMRLALGAAGAAGLALGALAVLIGPAAARLRLEDILLRGRWWDVDAQTLLTERLPAANGALGTALTLPLQAMPVAAAVMALLALAAAALSMGTLAAVLRRKSAGLALVAAAAAVALAVAAALLVPTAAVLVVWIVGRLNFWIFAVAGIAFQYYRHGRA
jgi:hypothetical protein